MNVDDLIKARDRFYFKLKELYGDKVFPQMKRVSFEWEEPVEKLKTDE